MAQRKSRSVIAPTRSRVPSHTRQAVNRRIRSDIRERVGRLATRRRDIENRLHELDREWDIERAIEANASVLALGGVVLAASVDKRWLALPGLVTAFLLQHAVQGWCPPVPVLRRLGFRTADEINQERYALKALRGDFRTVRSGNADEALAATEIGR